MWSRRRTGVSLAGQLLALQLVVVALVLLIVGVLSFRQSTQAFEDDRGERMRSVAEYLANVSAVRTGVGLPRPSSALAAPVDRARSLSGASDVTVAAPDGTVLASSDPSRVGGRADLGDSRVREGRGWTGEVRSGDGSVIAAHAPILSDDGRLVGLSIAEQAYPTVWQRLTNAASDLLVFLGVGAVLGVAGSWLVARTFRRRTRGLATHEIGQLADHREALLHSIREGVVAVGTDGRVTMANDGALELLGLPADVVGRPVDDLGLDAQVADVLRSPDGSRDAVVLVGSRVLVLNQRAASSRGRGIGTVTTMRDRTELTALREQLSSNLTITDTLRAQTHEFANRLHTISGLVELEEYDEVRGLVGELSRRRASLDAFVSDRVRDPATAALLIAKGSVADEAGVDLQIAQETRLDVLGLGLSADVTTVVGNLVDNAVDACRGTPGATVRVSLAQDERAVVVEVADSGPGVPDALRGAVFTRGFSTKPEVLGGRGIGLPMVRLLCQQRGGDVVLVDGTSTCFRAVLPESGEDDE